ncbi:TetR/AcrR family transcriptional regulator [Streptomyces sp. ME19-01-6]|uniref:TetR/AcrR family transcriptional regulator n=1 Tax=Streptomyces sp. ME19-01-6 TaxID=3028686 RepID=UPI0029B618F7|nr:TetR/AcrR family transcriptional regulator C-terminal domain-containing protein [Streptomyces sp. ME19-01-6]MDX3231493.1 TetR/AcrR family transcriptional regulator C-terminal domain-containing protein [Streptomyces sp. ME19-01-6]
MAKERSGAGDPARTLELLWREPAPADAPPRRGPKQGLSVDAVVQAAIALADSGGLEALTMRGVAQRLGVTPMTLYTYVPGKAELLDLMLDTAYLEMEHTACSGRPAAAPWRARVEAIARENLELCRRHPWVATLPATRPPLGPGIIAKYEHELAAFEGLGLDDIEIDAALTFLLDFVRSVARAELDAQAAGRESAMSDAQWWEAHAPLLAKVFDAERYPLAARVGSAAGEAHQSAYNPEYAFRFGLARALDGLAALIESRAAS